MIGLLDLRNDSRRQRMEKEHSSFSQKTQFFQCDFQMKKRMKTLKWDLKNEILELFDKTLDKVRSKVILTSK